ncbi:hypothetical protein [Sphingomonas sp.]|uniref:hypothetical protein n=1 Tax=Sphingomonas sp. TaxID=28214 RepID=UPI003BA96F6D
MVPAGGIADADDWNAEWFAPVGQEGDEYAAPDLVGATLAQLIQIAIDERVIPDAEEMRLGLLEAIQAKRDGTVNADDDAVEGLEPNPAAEPGDIATAIGLLDSKDDTHWTEAGLPAVDAVKAIVGRNVTRAEINEAAPDFMRPAA